MDGPFLQIVITLWLSLHPVRYALPKIYFDNETCQARVEQLQARARHRPKVKMDISCEESDKRNI